MQSIFLKLYTKTVLTRPVFVILALIVVFSYLGFRSKDFRLDASADTLILENDKDLKFFRKISKRYRSNAFLLLTYKPKGDLFSLKELNKLKTLRDDLKKLEHIKSVITILDVPLLRNPPVPIKEIAENIKTLEDASVDLELAKKELKNSPIYQELLVSPTLKTTTLQIVFKKNEAFSQVIAKRDELKKKQALTQMDASEISQLKRLESLYKSNKIRHNRERHSDIAAIRKIIEGYKKDAVIFLGGASMIADDMITFVKNDIKVFGMGMLIFLIATLGLIFKRIRWVILPILCCSLSVLSMTGILGIFGWEVTVISSNFISLQLIVTMSLTIHLIVRYRELLVKKPGLSQMELVKETVATKFIPCLYTTLTTIAGFSSLLVCDILPVIDFGWMMSVGLIVSLVVIFLLFPAILILLPALDASLEEKQFGRAFTHFLSNITENHSRTIFVLTGLLIVVTIIGISRLTVENSFIDYFKKSTEIYKGMKVIDQELGGTTPLTILINLPETEKSLPARKTDEEEIDDDFSEFEEFEDEENQDKYWFTSDKMALIKKVHMYLEGLPEVGKVLSIGTMMMVAEEFNNNKPLDNLELALLYQGLPEKFKDMILSPYVSIEENQARLSIRIKDSLKGLKRNNLLKKIRFDLENKLDLKKDQVHLTGVMILYNNMLQSLFSSQILSMGFVVIALLIMFMALFRSVKIALIALFPNLLSATIVLGVMGIFNFPLDMMTITIAAISIGIAVDNTIHYIHRFKTEFEFDGNYINTMKRCHASIGNAMFYTSFTVIIGFSILIFSNFIPTVLFGLLTGFSMLVALIAALSLLPRLIIVFKPL